MDVDVDVDGGGKSGDDGAGVVKGVAKHPAVALAHDFRSNYTSLS